MTAGAQIKQWCPNCGAATPSVIIAGYVYCAVCEPDGPNWDDEVDEVDEDDWEDE